MQKVFSLVASVEETRHGKRLQWERLLPHTDPRTGHGTWFVGGLHKVLGRERLPVGVLGVRRQPGVEVGAEDVHDDLGTGRAGRRGRPQHSDGNTESAKMRPGVLLGNISL